MRRLAAVAALALLAASLVLAIVVTVTGFPAGISVLLCAVIAAAALIYGIVRRGLLRFVGVGVAAAALVGAIVLVISERHVAEDVAILAMFILALGAAGRAFRPGVELLAADPPRRPVLFFNPKSGGGKAERFNLAAEARDRGIEAVELQRDDDLEALVRAAVGRGADALAAAGGDGTQAIIAGIAAQLDLPFACIPAGTRNHLALDLGVDRDDVVGALDAFVDGGERRVDLAEVNGQVFVNNVSLGVYAEAVQREEYRDAKIRTLLATAPDVLGPEGERLDLRWTAPDGTSKSSGAAILVSNNSYRLGRLLGSGTRPQLDAGVLGVAVVDSPSGGGGRAPKAPRQWQWAAPSFEVESERPVPAGIDGEAVVLDPPLRFRILPGALRARIARAHPGESPSARLPDRFDDTLRGLLRIAGGKERAGSAD